MSTVPFLSRRKEEIADCAPPYDTDAEIGTLGACMLGDAEVLAKVRSLITWEDFWSGYHQDVFKAILSAEARSGAPDIITVNAELKLRGVIPGSDDALIGLSEMIQKSPLAYKGPEYAEIVRGLAFKRQVIEKATMLLIYGYDSSISAVELRDRIQATITPVTSIEWASGWDHAPDLDEAPRAAPFPLDILPLPLVEMCKVAARLYPCPPDYVAVPCLAIAGGVIGRSLSIRIKQDWSEGANIFASIVGAPGTAKSPALRLVSGPIWDIHSELLWQYDAEMAMRAEMYQRAKENRKANDPAIREDPKPPLQRIVTGDATCEALAVLLKDNPRGMIMIRDELSGWINGFNQYKGGGGNDRDFYLQLWNGSPIPIDRKGQEGGIPVYVGHPCFALVGATTPDMIQSLPTEQRQGKTRDDGFVDRCLFSYPEEVPMSWSWDTVDPDLVADWEGALRRLWSRQMIHDQSSHRDRPFFLDLTDGARQAWESFMDAHIKETLAPDFPSYLKGPWSKFRTHCARLALIIDQLWWAYDPTSGDGLERIRAASIERATMAVSYFKTHFRRMLGVIEGTKADSLDGRAILAWAVQRGEPRFREADANDNFRRRFEERPEDFFAALAWLEARHCVRRVPEPARAGPGRRPRPTFELHPKTLLGSAR